MGEPRQTPTEELETLRRELAALRRDYLETDRARLAAEQRGDDLAERLKAAREEVGALRRSASWRASAPLRWPRLISLRARDWQATVAEKVDRHDGVFAAIKALIEAWRSPNQPQTTGAYQRWIDQQSTRADTAGVESLAYQPRISVLVPVFNPPPDLLKAAIESVCRQHYPHWELCLADDCSTDPSVKALLAEAADWDERINVVYRPSNGHISAASNTALEAASGEYVALLDQDDLLADEALLAVAESINAHPDAVILYSDEDRIEENTDRRIDPYFKADYDYELLLAQNLISHLGVYRRSEMEAVGGFREGFEGSQDLDLALRVIERIRPEQVVHIPRVLYHWRAVAGSTALANDEKGYATGIAARAVREHLQRTGQQARVEPCPDLTIFQSVNYRDGAAGLAVTAALTDPQAEWAIEKTIEDARVDYLHAGGEGGYACRFNRAVAHSQADVLFFLDDGIASASPGALEHLGAWAVQARIGCVAPRVWSTRRRLDHGGLVFSDNDTAQFVFQDWRRGLYGYGARAVLHQRYAALSPFAFAMARSTFESLGGLDECFRSHLAAVDLMLRAHRAGLHNIWLPAASLKLLPGRGRAKANLFADARIPAVDRQRWREHWPDWPAGEGVHPCLSADGDYDLVFR
jgi:glycosyltransferase involved in cell wall biosynthesis